MKVINTEVLYISGAVAYFSFYLYFQIFPLEAWSTY